MRPGQWIGLLLIAGAIGIFLPYTVLVIQFDYPDILRKPTSEILLQFNRGGSSLLLTWWAFSLLGLPLVAAYVLIDRFFDRKLSFLSASTYIGVAGLLVQMFGLLRWVFIVPFLSDWYITGTEVQKETSSMVFQVFHRYLGVGLGEHLGQLFTVIYSISLTLAIQHTQVFPKWTVWLGYLASTIYLLAQVEYLALVLPLANPLEWAGFVGSSLWLVWLMVIGVYFFNKKDQPFLRT